MAKFAEFKVVDGSETEETIFVNIDEVKVIKPWRDGTCLLVGPTISGMYVVRGTPDEVRAKLA